LVRLVDLVAGRTELEYCGIRVATDRRSELTPLKGISAGVESRPGSRFRVEELLGYQHVDDILDGRPVATAADCQM
jgi:hypothetical protein